MADDRPLHSLDQLFDLLAFVATVPRRLASD
ncbi:hypothetical protein FHS30_002878 [Simiduia aestuariiviva]|uniref:Uncharacterized protein n=1 Tax=Simiduia aestuariiviva TaxID=1510459 RepID=A0A839UWF6_9GAMM|nr:hypothetical protein [Simiduia aestuariiviva]